MSERIKRWRYHESIAGIPWIHLPDDHYANIMADNTESRAMAQAMVEDRNALATRCEEAERDRDAARGEAAELRQQRDHHARQRSIEGIDARVALDAAMDHLRWTLPMAKAWAAAHDVGRNAEIVNGAQAFLAAQPEKEEG